MQHQAVADQPPVDEDVDRIAIGLLHLRAREEAVEAKAAEGRILGLGAAVFGNRLRRRHAGRRQKEIPLAHADLHQFVQNLAAENLVDALLHAGHGSDAEQLGGPGAQAETLIRMRQAVVRHQRGDVRQFGLLGAQEFAARRDVVEQIAHRDHGAAAQRRLLAAQHLAAGDFDARAGRLLHGSRLQQQARDRGDGRQRLAAKTQRGDGEQVLDVAQFAGGVAFEGQQRVVAQHAAAVVHDADQPPAARFHLHAQIRRAGIERVFQQFLDHRRGPLHHFARGDLVGNLVGKNANAAHEE